MGRDISTLEFACQFWGKVNSCLGAKTVADRVVVGRLALRFKVEVGSARPGPH